MPNSHSMVRVPHNKIHTKNIYVFKSISSRSKQFNTMFFHLLGGYNKKHKAVILVPTALMKEYLSTTPKHMNIFI